MFKEIAEGLFEIPQTGNMRVPGLVVTNKAMLSCAEMKEPIEQIKNVAHLPGILGHSIAMPDVHWGYGFPIGGVAAMDLKEGVISPGGVGYDINCGVRLAIARIDFDTLSQDQRKQLADALFAYIPSGIGQGQKKEKRLTALDYKKIISQGALWAVEQGYGYLEDLKHSESHGRIEGGDLSSISMQAQKRGELQLGTIGSGNHFVEIGKVQKILDKDTAQKWGIAPGWTYLLIHSGSRGFGHQVCQDTLDHFIQSGYAENLPDRQLVAAPIKSEAGQQYLAAMASAANFAFNNRQLILHSARLAMHTVLGIPKESVRLLYDVCHNIAKMEKHTVEGKSQVLCVHRKGATRAFGPLHEELAPCFQETGQPVLVPGDMGRASYLLAGLGNKMTWCSACHGAGRQRSRVASKRAWQGKNLKQTMQNQGVCVMAASMRTIAEEMPDAYKDIDEVTSIVEKARLAKKVARLIPKIVVKG